MGRRALRKTDPALDLAPFLFELEDLPNPFSAPLFFQRDAPLEIEVGSGKGLFLASAAERHPDHNFLGIEVARKYARFCAARLAKSGLENGKMVSGDALRAFREFFPTEHAVAVHVYFPDPWWKKRHRKRRVMQAAFVRDIERVLVAGGYLHFWTDVKEYFDETVELIGAESTFLGPIPVPEMEATHDLDFRTHFERRMRLSSLPVYRAQFQKPQQSGTESSP